MRSPWVLVGQASQAAEKLNILSFRGTLRAEESLFSRVSITERFLAEFIPIPTGTRNDKINYFFRKRFSLSGSIREENQNQTGSPSLHSG
jgi:hypothetical protein